MSSVELGRLIRRGVKSLDPKKHPDEEFALCSISAFDNGEPEILKGSDVGSSKKILIHGDVVISRIVPHIRRVWVVPNIEGKKMLGSGEWIVFNSGKTDSCYLKHFLASNGFHQKFIKTVKGVGGSLLRADPNQTAKIQIPLPPLPIQKKIAEVLDAADRIRQRNKEVLAKYDQLAQSVFLEMFGDPVKNEKGWEIELFEDVLVSIVGGTSVGGEDRKINSGENAVLKISAVTSGFFKADEYKVVPSIEGIQNIVRPLTGDLLFSRANTKELVGAVAIVDNDYHNLFLPDKLWRLDLCQNKIIPPFCKFVFSHHGFRYNMCKVATGTSGSMLNISKAKLRNLKIIVPPLSLQNQFASIIERIEQQKAQAQAELERSEELFGSLMQRAFKGELAFQELGE